MDWQRVPQAWNTSSDNYSDTSDNFAFTHFFHLPLFLIDEMVRRNVIRHMISATHFLEPCLKTLLIRSLKSRINAHSVINMIWADTQAGSSLGGWQGRKPNQTIKCYVFPSNNIFWLDVNLRRTSQRRAFRDAWKALKSVFGRGSTRTPLWNSRRSPYPRLTERNPSSSATPLRLRRLGLGAFEPLSSPQSSSPTRAFWISPCCHHIWPDGEQWRIKKKIIKPKRMVVYTPTEWAKKCELLDCRLYLRQFCTNVQKAY